MTHSSGVVIVGGGLAAVKSAGALRQKGFDGPIAMFDQSKLMAYARPPLSKGFLLGKMSLPDFTMVNEQWFSEQHVDLNLGTAVTAINTVERTVTLGDANRVGYDKLLLATGSRARRLPVEGADAEGVYRLRTYEDAAALKDALTRSSSLVVIGAGFIGLEVAAVAREMGLEVSVVESGRLPLAPLGPEVGKVFADLHGEHGARLLPSTGVAEIVTEAGRARGVRLTDGTTIDADAVLVAIGAQPNVELAEQAGLTVSGGGVLVDASLRTSQSDIFAVGDIATATHPHYGVPVRSEHWATAETQPTVAAAGIVGTEAVYDELPYFYTDQYDLAMEYVGYAPRYERVVFRGDVDGRAFSAFWLDSDKQVLAGMNVNMMDGAGDIRKLIQSRSAANIAKLADCAVALTDTLAV
ncbi:FAD-dependent oxidoreductase [Mycolicibacterium sp. BiH015]|uniref:NAD(P)/FAD-dependent oxidoreductase n=1 Tax=Mycolicibacterium sp. BiH015 TaxID=3018808 RepID=UPI0022E0392E|nr:FAD-dependent oxidoreductase [Mycolicibacterium sp. BiH015]MDA2893276.1 FAD-dependent oxidoreductase [Mycolicibacterium sp. BiH015]